MEYTRDDLPLRMRHLPTDPKHGDAPVPWFVEWIDGEPEFRVMSHVKLVRAIKEKLCWVCGQRLGVHVTFPLGPMCTLTRTNAEPPSHYECALWSVKHCPFLSNPHMVRREDERVNNATLNAEAAGLAIARNPGVMALWRTRSYEVFLDPKGMPLLTAGEPETVEWWTQGRVATRAEVIESIESGLPILERLAREETGGMAMLERYKRRAWKWLPADPQGAEGT